ncbi:MAG: 3',5'-cyclic AMP phosphodiesterase CpdA, partial [Phenylobacterium sp.]
MYDEKNNTDSNLRPLRWLHISDIHLGDSDWDVWMSTANAFLNSISQQVSEHQFTPDVIFITGDLTLSATPEQFDKFKLFIDQIYDAIGTTLPVITVPGNHDLSRPDMEKTTNFKFNQLKEYSNQEDTEEVSCIKRELWEEANAEYIEPLFTSYQSFFNAHIKPTLNLPGITFKPSFFPGDIKVELALKGCVPVTIIGLNSSWLQYNGDNYQGKLCVHPKQFTHLFNSTELKDFDQCHSLLLMHHPVSWLHEPAQQEFEKSIYQPNSFNACFHGHMHETRTVHVSNGNGNRHYFQSPSLLGIEGYGSKHEERQIGYTLGELNSDGDIIVWPYKQAKRDNFFHFDNSVVENTNEQTGIEIRFAKDLEKQKVNAHNSASRTDEKQEESPKPEAKEDVNKQTEPNDEKQQSQTKDTSN